MSSRKFIRSDKEFLSDLGRPKWRLLTENCRKDKQMPSWGGFEKGVSVGESYHFGGSIITFINSHT